MLLENAKGCALPVLRYSIQVFTLLASEGYFMMEHDSALQKTKFHQIVSSLCTYTPELHKNKFQPQAES
jgi:hypothetical protein